MPSLPKLSGRAVAKAFQKGGWQLARQKGSHMIMVKDGSWATLSIPDHREIAPGTLRRPHSREPIDHRAIHRANAEVRRFAPILGCKVRKVP
jgi:predicted RNA binding protein YcfA (HicA-like mRNA interferase family)